MLSLTQQKRPSDNPTLLNIWDSVHDNNMDQLMPHLKMMHNALMSLSQRRTEPGPGHTEVSSKIDTGAKSHGHIRQSVLKSWQQTWSTSTHQNSSPLTTEPISRFFIKWTPPVLIVNCLLRIPAIVALQRVGRIQSWYKAVRDYLLDELLVAWSHFPNGTDGTEL